MGSVQYQPAAEGAGPGKWFANPRTVDGIVAGSVLLIAAITLINPGVELTRPQQTLALIGSLIQAGALLFRRQRPVTVLIVTTVVLMGTVATIADPVAADIGVAFALYAVAAQRPTGIAWTAWGSTIAGVWAWYLMLVALPVGTTRAYQGLDLLTAGSTLSLISLVAFALGLTVHNRRVRVAALQERVAQLLLEREQREQLAAAAERARMAREMHDVVAHSVAVMVTLAHGAAAALEKNPDQSRQALAALSNTGRAALADMHRIVGLLRDDVGDSADPDAPLGPGAVTELIERFQQAGLPIRVVERGPALPEDPQLLHAIYRIVQECLTNVLRHAPGTRMVDVRLDRASDHVTVIVANTGGLIESADASGGRGLAGIRERAAAHRGTVEAGPTTTGWQVHATLRYEDEEAR